MQVNLQVNPLGKIVVGKNIAGTSEGKAPRLLVPLGGLLGLGRRYLHWQICSANALSKWQRHATRRDAGLSQSPQNGTGHRRCQHSFHKRSQSGEIEGWNLPKPFPARLKAFLERLRVRTSLSLCSAEVPCSERFKTSFLLRLFDRRTDARRPSRTESLRSKTHALL